MKHKQKFWEADLGELVQDWGRALLALLWEWAREIAVFLMTGVAFIGMALPVLIPAAVMWYLAGFPRLFVGW